MHDHTSKKDLLLTSLTKWLVYGSYPQYSINDFLNVISLNLCSNTLSNKPGYIFLPWSPNIPPGSLSYLRNVALDASSLSSKSVVCDFFLLKIFNYENVFLENSGWYHCYSSSVPYNCSLTPNFCYWVDCSSFDIFDLDFTFVLSRYPDFFLRDHVSSSSSSSIPFILQYNVVETTEEIIWI